MSKQLLVALAIVIGGALAIKVSLDRGTCGMRAEFQQTHDAIDQAMKKLAEAGVEIKSEQTRKRGLWDRLVCIGY